MPNPAKKRKHPSKNEIIKAICKDKIASLDHEENLCKDNRFSLEEKRKLLDAYHDKGFTVFHDYKLLKDYLPNRQEADLKGLLERLSSGLTNRLSNPPQTVEKDSDQEPCGSRQVEKNEVTNLIEWQNTSRKLINRFAQDRKIGIEDLYSGVLAELAESDLGIKLENPSGGMSTSDDTRNILINFSQLLQGKFPERPSPEVAALSMQLFADVNDLALSIDVSKLPQLSDGSWLKKSLYLRQEAQQLAMEGLDMIDGKLKKCPSIKDIESDRRMEALCLELPKIKRITDVLNPLHIDKTTADALIEQLIDTSN